MKKFLSLILAVLMIVPMFAQLIVVATNVTNNTTEDVYRADMYMDSSCTESINWLCNNDAFVYSQESGSFATTVVQITNIFSWKSKYKEAIKEILVSFMEEKDSNIEDIRNDERGIFYYDFINDLNDLAQLSGKYDSLRIELTSEKLEQLFYKSSVGDYEVFHNEFINMFPKEKRESAESMINDYLESSEYSKKIQKTVNFTGLVTEVVDIAKKSVDTYLELKTYNRCDQQFIDFCYYLSINSQSDYIKEVAKELYEDLSKTFEESQSRIVVDIAKQLANNITTTIVEQSISKIATSLGCASLLSAAQIGIDAGMFVSDQWFSTKETNDIRISIRACDELTTDIKEYVSSLMTTYQTKYIKKSSRDITAKSLIYYTNLLYQTRILGENLVIELKDTSYHSQMVQAIHTLGIHDYNEDIDVVNKWANTLNLKLKNVENQLFRNISPSEYMTVSFETGNTPSTIPEGYIKYDADAAVAYSYKYVKNYNSAYFDFNPYGGDCTNYVSQCLYAGGMPQVVGSIYGVNGWFYKAANNRSATWTGAGALRTWLANNQGVLINNPSASDILKGNPVFYDWENDGIWDHATICVGKNSAGVPIINSHNENVEAGIWNYGGSSTKYSTVQLNYLSTSGSSGNSGNVEFSFDATTSKSSYTDTENVVVKWTSVSGATEYGLTIVNNNTGEIVIDRDGFTGTSANLGKLPSGSYRYQMGAYNNGTLLCSYSPLRYFTVTEQFASETEKSVFSANENVIITWNAVTGASYYGLTIKNDNTNVAVFDRAGLSGTSITIGKLPVGKYRYQMGAYNSSQSLIGEYSPLKYFEVVDKTYIVIYNANGGSSAPASQSKSSGKALTLSTAIPTRSGKTFLGWARSASATSAEFAPGGIFNIDADTTLYAVWSDATSFTDWTEWSETKPDNVPNRIIEEKTQYGYYHYVHKWNDTGFTGAYPVEDSSLFTNDASDSHPKHEYWSDVKLNAVTTWQDKNATKYNAYENLCCNLGTNVSSVAYHLYSDGSTKTLYRYRDAEFVLSYNANGGDNAPSSQTQICGTNFAISNARPTRTGYTFKGWSTSSNGPVAYAQGATMSISSNITLFAVWSPNTYKVSFNGNGGKVTAESKEITFGNVYGDLPLATRDGYTFIGWFESANGGNAYSSSSQVKQTNNHTLFAGWKANEYTVTFDCQSGTAMVDKKKVTFGSSYGELPLPIREGYSFVGWFSQPVNGLEITEEMLVSTTMDHTVYAVWEKQIVSVASVSLNQTGATLKIGDTLTLTATVSPANATNKSVIWASTDENVATVVNGVVTAKNAGTATIIVKTTDGSKTASCVVTVKDKEVIPTDLIFSLGEGKVGAGKTVNITLNIKNNPGIAGMGFDIGYNSDVMTLVAYESNSAWYPTSNFEEDPLNNPVSFFWSKTSDYRADSTLLTLTFKIKENAPVGEYPITLKASEKIVNQNLEELSYNVVSGKIIVVDYIAGDANGDALIDTKDAVLLAQYLAKWSVSVDMSSADCNADGFVDTKDAVLLAQYLAKWDVTLG